jgi:SET domain-containing protein
MRTYIKIVCPPISRKTNWLNLHNRYLNRYTGLNYLFDLNKSLALDALTVGNETRYLNHHKDPNVMARGGSLRCFVIRRN